MNISHKIKIKLGPMPSYLYACDALTVADKLELIEFSLSAGLTITSSNTAVTEFEGKCTRKVKTYKIRSTKNFINLLFRTKVTEFFNCEKI
jgi:hypothetical protein